MFWGFCRKRFYMSYHNNSSESGRDFFYWSCIDDCLDDYKLQLFLGLPYTRLASFLSIHLSSAAFIPTL